MRGSNLLGPVCCRSEFWVVMMTYSFHSKHLSKLTTSEDADFGRMAQGAASPVRKANMLRNNVLKVHTNTMA